jgi:broad specificity phosphatase PhoE
MSEAGVSGGIEEDGRIFIVRHAESAANGGDRTGDSATIPITETGAREAQQVANVIPPSPTVIVVSRYLRTVETATPLLKRYPGVPVERWPVEAFTYLDIAASAGTTYAEREGFRDAYWGRSYPLWTDGPGCESFTDFVARVRRFEQALSVRGADGTVVVYSHGLIMQALLWLQQHSSGNGSGHIRISAKVTVPHIPSDRHLK